MSSSAAGGAPRRVRARTYAFFFAAFALVVFLTHTRYYNLPYYWDELGQFVPAALDIFQRGAWIPQRTIPNVHPPGLMAYLAGVWTVFGYSIAATRLAMLALASLAALIAFLLAIELTKGAKGAPAFAAVVLLLASPLVYTQSMLAQLDLPAMLFSSWALLLFLQNRFRAAALASVALVLVKETGIVVPAVLGIWLAAERKPREAAWFVLPFFALAGWIAALWAATGNLLGNSEFANYNLFFPLHPVRLAGALLRRAFFLGIEHFHWIGWIFVVPAFRRGAFAGRAWRVAAAVAAAQVLVVTVFGGAVLERYLLPVLPILYAAFAAATPRFAQLALVAGLVFSLFWNPPYPYPFENNLAMVDFVRLQQAAAEYVAAEYPDRAITTAWPLTAALWIPELGYVEHRMHIRRIADFTPPQVAKLAPGSVEVFVLFSREWDRPWDLRRAPWIIGIVRRVYHWEPQMRPGEIACRFGLAQVAEWRRGGQWAVVLARPE